LSTFDFRLISGVSFEIFTSQLRSPGTCTTHQDLSLHHRHTQHKRVRPGESRTTIFCFFLQCGCLFAYHFRNLHSPKIYAASVCSLNTELLREHKNDLGAVVAILTGEAAPQHTHDTAGGVSSNQAGQYGWNFTFETPSGQHEATLTCPAATEELFMAHVKPVVEKQIAQDQGLSPEQVTITHANMIRPASDNGSTSARGSSSIASGMDSVLRVVMQDAEVQELLKDPAVAQFMLAMQSGRRDELHRLMSNPNVKRVDSLIRAVDHGSRGRNIKGSGGDNIGSSKPQSSASPFSTSVENAEEID
jgi:hypothetical protein